MVFSVVIPLYNKENEVKNAINSVLSQTFSDMELLVVNDGATDKSMDVVSGFNDERIRVFSIKNQGPSAARNLGIKNAKGKLIAFLDADDYWEKDHLEKLQQLQHTFADAGLYCMGYNKIYAAAVKKSAVFSGIPERFSGLLTDYFKAAYIDSPASASSVCVPAPVFKAVGLFDTSMRSGEDTDMWIRIALKYKVAMDTTTTANYNIHIPNSLSKGAFEEDKLKLVSEFIHAEKKNPTLKKYIDLNRYAFAIGYRLSGKKKLRKAALENIDYGNLNFRQRILLRTPKFMLKRLKHVQRYMAGKNRYLSTFGG